MADAAVQARLKEWAELLTAFYEGKDAAQKAWLDRELNRRRAAPHAWRDALLWLAPPRAVDASHGAEYYVTYFAASVLEEAVRVGFGSERVGAEGRRAVRSALFDPSNNCGVLVDAAAGRRPKLPRAISTRLQKVYVDVGKVSWPSEVPDYLDEICRTALSSEAPTKTLGLDLLALAAEEFCSGSKIPVARGRELKEGVALRLPQIVALLCDVLVATDADAMQSALKCLETLVTWAPLKGYVTRDLLRTLVKLVDEDLRTKTFCGDAAARALDAILSKNLIPPDMEGFIDEVGALVLGLLRTLASALDSHDDEDQEEVLAATAELVSTFVELHVPRISQRPDFPVAELLGLLARVLFSRNANPRTLRRNLRPWDTLVNYLGETDVAPPAALASGVVDVVVAFFRDRCLFEHNVEALADLAADDDSDGEDKDKAFDNDEDLIEELAGGLPAAPALGGEFRVRGDGGELRGLIMDGQKLCAQACRGPLSAQAAPALCRAALQALEVSLAKALPPPEACQDGLPSSCRPGAIDAATSLYVLAASAPACDQQLLYQATEAVASLAHKCITNRAHALGPAHLALGCASLDALRSLAPACAVTVGEQCLTLIDGLLGAAFAALDDQIAPAPEPLARCAAWTVLAVAKAAPQAPWLGRSEKLRALGAAGAADAAARRVAAPARALALRAALAAHAAAGQGDADAILAAPLVTPIVAAAQKLQAVEDAALFASDALDAQTLNLARGGARALAALCAGAFKDGVRTPFRVSLQAALSATPRLLAYAAARALQPQPDRSAPPHAARQVAASRAPHLALATALADLNACAAKLDPELGGDTALSSATFLRAALDATRPASQLLSENQATVPPRKVCVTIVQSTIVVGRAACQGRGAQSAALDLCALLLDHCALLSRNAQYAPDLLPPLLDTTRRLLVDRWAAFVRRPTGATTPQEQLAQATAPAVLVDERAARLFHALCDLCCFAARGDDLPPRCVEASLSALADADAKRRLFDFPPFVERWRAPLCDALLGALLDGRHALLGDEAAALLHRLAAPDMAGFFGAFLPQRIAALDGLDEAQRRAVLWPRADDRPSFITGLKDAAADVAHYRLVNTPRWSDLV